MQLLAVANAVRWSNLARQSSMVFKTIRELLEFIHRMENMRLKYCLAESLVARIGLMAFGGLLLTIGCPSPRYADRGAALGGLTGAGVGAAIGHANNNTLAGTLIGGTVGAVSGAMVGDALDEIDDRNQQMIEDRLGRRLQGSTSPGDIVSMSQAGLGNDVIIQHLRSHGFAGDLSPNTLVSLKQQGVDDQVIRAVQDLNGAPTAAVPMRHRPVVVEEHYYAAPPYPRRHLYGHRHGHRYGHRHPGRHPGVGWSVAWHN